MSDCEKCGVERNLNRVGSKWWFLKCSKCGLILPLQNRVLCPQCKAGVLVWTPKEEAKK